jgi:WD40 repeat protein
MTRVVWLAALVVLALATGLTFLLALVILISARQQDAPPEVAADVAASSSRPSARGSRGAGSAPAPAASTGSAAAASTSAPPAPPSRWRVVELQAADSEPVIPPPAQSSSDSLPPLRAIALPGWGDNSSRGSREMIIRLDFSHDGTRLASRNDRGDGLIWNVALAKSFNHFGYSGHYGHTHNWSPVDNFIVHSSTHRLAVRGERDARDLWLEWIPEVYGVAYSADGKEILAGARTLWSIPSDGGQLQELYTSDGASVNEIEVSVDGKVIAAVGGGGAPFLRFLFAKGHHEPIESLTPQAPVKEAKWSTDGKYFAYRTLRYVYVVSRQTGRTVARFAVPRGRTDTFDFLHGGEIFVHKGDGLECRDVETGQLRLKLDTAMVVTCLAVAPDGETLAAASFGDIYIWRIPRETAVESPSP